MPELPEVETIVRDLKSELIGKEIKSLIENRPKTIFADSLQSVDLEKIKKVFRRGKYINLETYNHFIIIHLRMTGKLILENNPKESSKHIRAKIVFSDGSLLLFDDVRTFGTINIIDTAEFDRFYSKLGIEPLSEQFDYRYLERVFKNRKAPVKNLILNQNLIAGVGNIYACEALYYAGVSPLKKGSELNTGELKKIVYSLKGVLKKAIKYNGTTISDYKRIDDKSGEFQNMLKIYQKNRCSCETEIKKIKQAGRSTYYCPNCQK